MSTTSNYYYIDVKLKNKKVSNTTDVGVGIAVDNILYMTIKENILSTLPRLEMVINDVGSLIENNALYDKDILSIVLGTSQENDAIINLDFNVSVFASETDSEDNTSNTIKLVGYLAVDNMFVPYKNRSFEKSSIDILSEVAKECGLNFKNPQSVKSNDKMFWYQDDNNFTFIKHVLKRSYVDNDAVFFYTNAQGDTIYTSLNKEMDKEEDFIARYDRNRVDNVFLDDDETNVMYYNASDILNLTEMYNNMGNYGASFGLYNLKGETENGIITDVKKFTDLKNRLKEYDGEPTTFNNIGLISNPNVFDQFPKAIIQNFYFKYNLFSVSISLTINASTDVKLFDKVNLAFNSTLDRDTINDVYSGHYLVTGITHNVTNSNKYEKQVILSRCGMNKTDNIREYEVN